MKKLITLLAFAIISSSLFAQLSATSIQDGNWMNPTTWDCSCIPVPSYTVTINHNVVLDTNYAHISGTFDISANASLVPDGNIRSFAITGGTLTNSGYFKMDSISNLGATIVNNDSINFDQFFNTGTLTNNHYLHCDSVTNTGNFTNEGTDSLLAFTNTGTYTNNGELIGLNFTNTSTTENWDKIDVTNIWNTGTMHNYGILTSVNTTNSKTLHNHSNLPGPAHFVAGNFFTTDEFINDGNAAFNDFANTGNKAQNNWNIQVTQNFYSEGAFLNAEYINVLQNFYNGDTTLNGSPTHFTNNGSFNIGANFWNADTIDGNGNICVALNSVNDGAMMGSFSFCDTTGGAVDFNSGTIASSVQYCDAAYTCFGPAPSSIVEEFESKNLMVYPNPTTGIINFETPITGNLVITDIYGKTVYSKQLNSAAQVNVSNLSNGIYIASINGATIRLIKQ